MKTLFVALILGIALTSCHRSDDSRFIGKWTKISGPGASDIEIAMNGDHYLLIENGSAKTGLTTKDGMLMIGGMFPITYIEASGHITLGGRGGTGEYTRTVAGAANGAQKDRVAADLMNMLVELKVYESMNGTLPTSQQGLSALVSRPTSSPAPPQWYQLFTQLPKDPWGSEYCYESAGSDFRLFSAGPDKKPHTADDISRE